MIITANDIRKVKPIATNIVDIARIEPYISNTEVLDVMPALKTLIFKQIEEKRVQNDQNDKVFDLENGAKKTIKKADFDAIFIPIFYNDNKNYSQGLVEATAYLAYSRFLPNNVINATAFGIKIKNTEFSSDVPEASMYRQVNEARKIGLEYLNQVIKYLTYLGLYSNTCEPNKVIIKRFKAIGR